jgi:ribosomal protein S18 acetylase RimI-like enzyme
VAAEVIYRPARKEDCPRLGELIGVAGRGMLEYLLDGLVPGRSAADIAAHDLAENQRHHSFCNATVAEAGGAVMGMALSFESRFHGITDDMRRFIPAERLTPLESFYSTRIQESLYLDTLAVDSALRGRGVGTVLLQMTKQKALALGCKSVSLIVLANNLNARRLYERQGFVDVKKVPMKGVSFLPADSAALLMEYKLAQC